MTDEKKGIWNGGTTNISKKEAKIFRQMEDHYDTMDSEIEMREDLKSRQEIMDKDEFNKKPLHELYTDIDYSEKTPITGMGGIGGPISSLRAKDESK